MKTKSPLKTICTIIITGLFVAAAVFAIMKITYHPTANQPANVLFGNDPSHEIEADQSLLKKTKYQLFQNAILQASSMSAARNQPFI